MTRTYIHTYLYNWSVQVFSQDYNLASHITYGVYVSFIDEWRDLKQFKVDIARQIFLETIHTDFFNPHERTAVY